MNSLTTLDKIKNRGNLVIIGAGEFGEIARDYFERDTDYAVCAFAVNRDYLKTDSCGGLPLVAVEDIAVHYPPADYDVFVALTFSKLNRDRARLVKLARAADYHLASYISPAAFMSDNTKIGGNVFIFENNVVQHDCELNDNVILWSGNHIGHGTVIEKNAFVSSHVVVSGGCRIGENSFIGVNSAIGHGVNVGRDCTIGAGATITNDIAENAAVQPEASPVRENVSRRLWKVRE